MFRLIESGCDTMSSVALNDPKKSRKVTYEPYDVLYESPRQSYVVTVEKGEDGWLVAKCDVLNIVTQGKTIVDVEKNAIEAIELALDDEEVHKEFSISIHRLY